VAAVRLICGVDEAGRGPLAGPVCAAAVVFDPSRRVPRGIADSKVLSVRERERVADIIKKKALAWSVAWASVEEIDSLNILQASLLAMRRAVESLSVPLDEVLLDGVHCPALAVPARAIVDGDAKVKVIAAASILAKTARDAEMCGDWTGSTHKRAATACSDVSALRNSRSTVRLQPFTDSLVLVRK